MGEDKAIEIDPYLKRVIDMAKFIIECYEEKQSFTIVKNRQDGVIKKAFYLARNLN